MSTRYLYSFPSSAQPKYYAENDWLYEMNGTPAFYIQNGWVYSVSGQPAFWIDGDYLYPHGGGSQPTLYFAKP